MPMWSKRFVGVAASVSFLAVAATASAQSALADRIAAGADVNQTRPDGSTPLHWAVYRVDRELVSALLKKRAHATVVNHYGASPLTEAARLADADLVGMLLDADADPNAANEDGQTA